MIKVFLEDDQHKDKDRKKNDKGKTSVKKLWVVFTLVKINGKGQRKNRERLDLIINKKDNDHH